MVVMRVDSKAGNMDVEMDVKAADKMVVNWFDLVVGEMGGCWDEKIVMLRVGLRAGWSAVKTAD